MHSFTHYTAIAKVKIWKIPYMKRFLILCLSLIAFANATHKITIKEDHAPALEASMTTSKQRVYVGEQFGINFELHAYENCMSVLGADSVDFGNNFSSYRNDNLKTESSSFGVHESLTTIPFAWWLIPNKSGNLQNPRHYIFLVQSKQEKIRKSIRRPVDHRSRIKIRP